METDAADTRRRLIHLVGYLAEATDIHDFDGTGEAAYAALYSFGLDESPDKRVGSILRHSWEAAAIEDVVQAIDDVLAAVGNCETETRNMKAAGWVRVRGAAQSAYNLLATDKNSPEEDY